MIVQKKILIADDHFVIRKALKALLEYNFRDIKIAEACSCNEIMRKLMQEDYAYIILDMVLTDGTVLEILPNIVRLYPRSSILIFSMQPATVYRRALNQYDIHYYMSKVLPEGEMVCLLGKFLNNECPAREEADAQVSDNPFSLLTARELEILHYILKGLKSTEIGNILNIKYNTVSTTRSRIFEKSQTSNITELFKLAIRYNVS
jgi:DNA-binding NarL/FixJ family response regulator